jgi:hypothetical protein
LAAEYVLPLRWDEYVELSEFTSYLDRLAEWIDVTVVDGSSPQAFAEHRTAWADLIASGRIRHLGLSETGGANGKVSGVITGVQMARHERVVIADDDVRYDLGALRTVVGRLDEGELVRPQNVLVPLRPADIWHTRWDTARTLLNRALGSDYPGTFALRRSLFQAMRGYSSDVLFENLELVRTMAAAGGREVSADDVFIHRCAPSPQHFFGQRVRQAYDSFAQPVRLVAEMSVLPLLACAIRARAFRSILLGVGATTALAEYGRRRQGAAAFFASDCAAWAPLWLLERSVCVWIAFGYRLRGGISYRGRRIPIAAHSSRWLGRKRI